jgi:hypothetical protein
MKERRTLVDGINPVDRTIEEQFVYASKAKPTTPGTAEPPSAPVSTPIEHVAVDNASAGSRLPLSTRIRSDYAIALKRASLERQLSGVRPSTLQDILEEALEPWLRKHGYIH